MITEEFLKHFPDHFIQTFDDRQDIEKDLSLTTSGRPEKYSSARLFQLNQRGAGIYFTPNRFPGERRGVEFCEGVSSWFVEADEISIEEQLKNLKNSPLEPSFMVQSKKSIHAYWLAKDAKKENFVKIQKNLIAFFHGDPACKDISRVLRIPGYLHNKKEPYLVSLIHAKPELIYTEEEMLKSFPEVVEKLEPISSTKQIFYETPEQLARKIAYWEFLARLSNKMMLERLSKSSISGGEEITFRPRRPDGEYIYVNGKMSDAWIDKNGMIGSGKGGGPTWIQWLTFFGVSKGDIARWFNENCGDLLPEELSKDYKTKNYLRNDESDEKIVKNVTGKILREDMKLEYSFAGEHREEIENIFKAPVMPWTWGTLKSDRFLPLIEPGHFIVLFGQSGSGKTALALFLARENAKTLKKVVFLTLEMTKVQIFKRYIRDRAGITKEDYKNKKFDISVIGKYLPELNGITFLGIDKGEIYTTKTIEKIIVDQKPTLLIVDNLNKIAGNGKNELEITQNVSQGILNLTRHYNIPIMIIHHANKPVDQRRKGNEGNTVLRGLAGMRGTNKVADDADIILEVARPDKTKENSEETEKNKSKFTNDDGKLSIVVYKDREFDSRGTVDVYYAKGRYYDSIGETVSVRDFETPFSKAKPEERRQMILDTAKELNMTTEEKDKLLKDVVGVEEKVEEKKEEKKHEEWVKF